VAECPTVAAECLTAAEACPTWAAAAIPACVPPAAAAT
jgi:hypothetical protein